MPDDEPQDAVPPRRTLSATEELWNKALSGRVRRGYAFGGEPLSSRYLPNALGLEPVLQAAYKYDSDGVFTEHADHVRIATELATGDGWLACVWHPECAEVFMRSADLIIWFDDPYARLLRRGHAKRSQNGPGPVEAVTREAWRAWRRRRRGEIADRPSLLEVARSAGPPDLIAPYLQVATSDFAGKLLHVTNDEQIAALQSVRPNR